MLFNYPTLGICGLSCHLCPSFHTQGKSRCEGCKSEFRMRAGCPFITCAVKKKQIEFCWQCDDNSTCDKWHGHREFSKNHDTFVCYQKLDDNIATIQKNGISYFYEIQRTREALLRTMLKEFNEGRSKRLFTIAATVMEISELEDAIKQAEKESSGLPLKEKAKVMHEILEEIAESQHYYLKLRK